MGGTTVARTFIAILGVTLAVAGLAMASACVVGSGYWMMRGHMDGMMGRGQDTADQPLTQADGDATVAIDGFAFSPGNLLIPLGGTVTWTNRDAAPHDATARDGSWSTPTIRRGGSAAVSFRQAGEFAYYCTIHPSMKARLTVR